MFRNYYEYDCKCANAVRKREINEGRNDLCYRNTNLKEGQGGYGIQEYIPIMNRRVEVKRFVIEEQGKPPERARRGIQEFISIKKGQIEGEYLQVEIKEGGWGYEQNYLRTIIRTKVSKYLYLQVHTLNFKHIRCVILALPPQLGINIPRWRA